MTSKALEEQNGQQNREHPSNSIFFNGKRGYMGKSGQIEFFKKDGKKVHISNILNLWD